MVHRGVGGVAWLLAGCAAPDQVPVWPEPEVVRIDSLALHEPRIANVWTPAPELAGPRPTVYLLDGGIDEDFGHVAAALEQAMREERIAPILLVGIANTERRRDFTGPTTVARDRAIAARVGGSAAFRAFLLDELIPAIDASFPSTGQRALVGESLAGLFVVETLLQAPTAFDRYVAFDPSLWWNDGALLAAAPEALRGPIAAAGPRMLWFAASGEPELAARAAEFASVLRAHAPANLTWSFAPLPAEEHGTIFRAAEAIAYAAALWQARAGR